MSEGKINDGFKLFYKGLTDEYTKYFTSQRYLRVLPVDKYPIDSKNLFTKDSETFCAKFPNGKYCSSEFSFTVCRDVTCS